MWSSEQEEYKFKETGTGVQNFVKKFIESEDFFNLNEGSLKTKREKRKNEFIHEKNTKERRQADFVIFIDSEIEIPVEVECFTHIEKGEEQLSNYQKDLEKKYGILTDGFNWWFYNNHIIEQKFTIDDIFNKKQMFLDFWREYIKPLHYYTTFFSGQLKEKVLVVDSNRSKFFEDTTFLIKNIRNKFQVEGYFSSFPPKEREKEATQIAYAYLIQFILYKTLVDNGFDDFDEEYQTNIKLITKYVSALKFKDIFGIIEGISEKISKNIYRPFRNEQEVLSQKIKDIYHKPENTLSDISPWLDILVYIKKYSFRNVQNDIFGFIYENYLKELFSEEERGQYYTDPAIVNFMIERIGYSSKDIKEKIEHNKEDKLSIIDPSCGSGTFLYTATDNIVNALSNNISHSKKIQELVSNNVFGLDIEEFPLYLAEMSILMRLLPFIINDKYNNPFEKKIKLFKTRDSISEFLGNIKNNRNPQMSLLAFQEPKDTSFMRDKTDIQELKDSLTPHSSIPRLRFDYVIGNPPYVSYNKCSKLGLESFKLIKEGKLKLNDVYGVNLHSVPDNPKRYRPNPNLYTFFIALGIALLKKNGKISYIIPQTVLVNSDFDVIRYYLAKFTKIEQIITFKGKMFVSRGLNQKRAIPTSSLIFVIENSSPVEKHEVEIINYDKEDDSVDETLKNIRNGKYKLKSVLQKDLLENISNWNFIKQSPISIEFMKGYKNNTDDMSCYYTHTKAQPRFGSRFFFDGGYSIDEKLMLIQPEDKTAKYYVFPKLDSNFWSIKDVNGYWQDIRSGTSKNTIQLRQASQGYNLLDSKYKVVWSYNNTDRFFLTDMPVIWARNKLLAIGSDNKNEMQYLFSLLNSKVTNYILKKYVKIEQEDTRTILVSLQTIEDLIRVPRITKGNKQVKEEIIRSVQSLIDAEERKLSDLVDLSGIMLQKFDDVRIEKDTLVLTKDNENIMRKIKTNLENIRNAIVALKPESEKLSLTNIKNLKVIDYTTQIELKDYIDDLVFSLYLNINLTKLGLKHAKEIKELCGKNKFYKLVNDI